MKWPISWKDVKDALEKNSGFWWDLTAYNIGDYLSGNVDTLPEIEVTPTIYKNLVTAACEHNFKGVIMIGSDGTEITCPAGIYNSTFDKNSGVFTTMIVYMNPNLGHVPVYFGVIPSEDSFQIMIDKSGYFASKE